MYTRLPAALAVCACATACVSSHNAPRPAPPPAPAPASAPAPAASAPAWGPGKTQATGPKARPDPYWQDPKRQDPKQENPASPKPDDEKDARREVKHLEVPLQPKSESPLLGKVELTDVAGGVKVVVHVDNIKPGRHGVHIHEFANCSAADATSAGGHFNPDGEPHALPSNKNRHLGDLGNLVAKAPDGKGRLEIVVPRTNLKVGAPRSLLNRSLVVHAQPDDGKEQPGGGAGKRIGCAELTIAAAKSSVGRVVMADSTK